MASLCHMCQQAIRLYLITPFRWYLSWHVTRFAAYLPLIYRWCWRYVCFRRKSCLRALMLENKIEQNHIFIGNIYIQFNRVILKINGILLNAIQNDNHQYNPSNVIHDIMLVTKTNYYISRFHWWITPRILLVLIAKLHIWCHIYQQFFSSLRKTFGKLGNIFKIDMLCFALELLIEFPCYLVL